MTKVKELLVKELGSIERYVDDESGDINWEKVKDEADSFNEELLGTLLKRKELRKHFFKKIGEAEVFDVRSFKFFIDENKVFNSYTQYKNRIGLGNKNGYLLDDERVVLSFPFKDAVLEGGQTKEESKRNEIFFNEILAKDEVDRLFDKKALVNWKKYTKKSVGTPENLTRDAKGKITDNLVIKGNNLLALHSLRNEFSDSVSLIYIDPPYNIGEDGFGYNDKFNHSTWLTFIRNRLEVAYDLLKDNGILMIHIGDTELHYLKVLVDEIFGRDRFIATVPRKTRSGKSDVPYKLSQDFDWILCYTKRASKTTQLFSREVDRKYYQTDDFPGDPWRLADLTTQRSTKERPNSDFTLVNPKNKEKFPVNPNRCWSVTKDTLKDFMEAKKIVFPGDYEFLQMKRPAMRVFMSEEIKKHGDDFKNSYVSTDFLNDVIEKLLSSEVVNKKGNDEIVGMYNQKAFSYPKNEPLLHKIIEATTKEGDIVLDFFAGSGTTGAVAHKMGRQYLLIEQLEYEEGFPQSRLKKVLDGDQAGISKELKWVGGGEFVYCELAKFNEKAKEKIQSAKTFTNLIKFFHEICEDYFLDYNLDVRELKKSLKEGEFKKLSLDKQKKLLLETLDLNQMYVNESEMADKKFGISKEDQKLTKEFYSK